MRFVTMLFFIVLTLASATSLADGKHYRPPRLPDGRPDLQGTWAQLNATPILRPAGYSTLVISPEQAAAIETTIYAGLNDPKVPNDPTSDLVRRHVLPVRGTLRSSIVIEPEDGLIPGTPLFKKLVERTSFNIENGMDGPEQRSTGERCLGGRVSQPPILHNPGDNLHQIVQTKDTVVFFSEQIHDARIIRLNAAHAPAAITSWLGDSIGWWDGDTLVVETKYFTPSDTGRQWAKTAFFVSPQTTVTEHFTRVSDNELTYVFTVDDPVYYTRPWKGETNFLRSNEQLFESACHEGNYAMTFILQGARELEKKARGSQ